MAGREIAQGIARMRKGQVKVEEGYDGVFGTVSVFSREEEAEKKDEDEKDHEQLSLF